MAISLSLFSWCITLFIPCEWICPYGEEKVNHFVGWDTTNWILPMTIDVDTRICMRCNSLL